VTPAQPTLEEAAQPVLRIRPPTPSTPPPGPVRTGPDRIPPPSLPRTQLIVVYAKIPLALYDDLKRTGVNISGTCRAALEEALGGDGEVLELRRREAEAEAKLEALRAARTAAEHAAVRAERQLAHAQRVDRAIDELRTRAASRAGIDRRHNMSWLRSHAANDRLLRTLDPLDLYELVFPEPGA